jgi:hypothetical protein
MNANENFTRSVSKATSPAEVFKVLEAYCQSTVGVKLFTVMTNDARTQEAERVYTNMPDAYPLSGRKAITRPAGRRSRWNVRKRLWRTVLKRLPPCLMTTS